MPHPPRCFGIGSESIRRTFRGEVVTQDADDATVTLLPHCSSASATCDLFLVHVGEDEEARRGKGKGKDKGREEAREGARVGAEVGAKVRVRVRVRVGERQHHKQPKSRQYDLNLQFNTHPIHI